MAFQNFGVKEPYDMGLRKDLNSCGQLSKYILFIINMLFFMIGCAVVGVGIWMLLERNYMSTIVGSLIMTAAIYIIIIGGAIIIFVSFSGCIGAIQENKCLILTYFICVLCIFVILLLGGILALVFRTQVGDEIRGKMADTLRKYYGVNLADSNNRAITNAWDKAQHDLYCCAVEDNNWGVYKESEWYKIQPGIVEHSKPYVPDSCCVYNQYDEYISKDKCQTWIQGPPGRTSGETNEALHYQGCYNAGRKFVWRYSGYLAGIGIGIALALVLGMACAIVLYMQLSRRT